MKHYATLLLLIAATFLHTNVNAFAQGITLKVKDESLENVFKLIQKQSSYSFVYSGDQLKGASKVSLSVVNENIRTVLDMVLKEQPFRYEISEAFVIIKKKQSAAQIALDADTSAGKPIDLFGKVVDQDGKPIAGATVTVRGTGASTATDKDGSFIIKAEEKGMLMITNVGYESKLVRITGGNLMVKLYVTAQQMKEVVISTGYQKVSSERFVGSYSQLDSATFHRMSGMNIIDRLDGTVSGVFFNKKDGGKIQIRGISTINSIPNPLIVVDNFPYPYDLNTINPNDVENIVVLKDAAATSIWGSRAGNGVIVVTTKKGKFNQPLSVSLLSNVSIQGKPRLFKYPSISSSDFIEVEKFLYKNNYYAPILSDNIFRPIVTPVVEVLDKMEKGIIDADKGNSEINLMKGHDIRNDLLDYVYQPQIRQQHSFGLAGGNQFLNYNISLGYVSAGPLIKGTKGDKTFTVNSSAAFRPIKNLEIRLGLGISQQIMQSTTFPSFQSYPYARLVDEFGKPAKIPFRFRMGYLDTAGGGALLDWGFRPLEEVGFANKKIEFRLANLNLGISYKINKWISAELLAQITSAIDDANQNYSIETFIVRDLINDFTNLNETDPTLKNPVPIGGILDIGYNKAINSNLRGQINFNHNWKNRHLIQGSVAGEVSEIINSGYSNRYYGFNSNIESFVRNVDYFNYYPLYGRDQTSTIPNSSSILAKTTSRIVSLLSNLSYTYNNSITLYASGRRDGSNIYGVSTNNKWKPLWSAGASWSIHKGNFYDLVFLSTLRLRLSYGYAGNSVNNFAGYTTILYSLFPAQHTNLLNATIGVPPNPNLKWEEVKTKNLGIDFGFNNNKIFGSIDVFEKESIDLIGQIPLPLVTGVQTAHVNSASLKGHGVDLNLNAKIIDRKEISWTSTVNFSYAKMKVTKIYLPFLYKSSDFIDFGIHPAVGKAAYSLSSYRWSGLDEQTGNPKGILDGKESSKYLDIFNDTVENQVLHGSAIPLYIGNLINTISWRNLSFSFNINLKFNYYFRKPALSYTKLFQGWSGISDFSKRWQKPGDEKFTSVPSMIYPVPNDLTGRDEFYQNSEINVLRGDNVRLQDFRIQYSPTPKSTKWIKQLSLYFYLNNLNIILWRKEKSDFDPEFTGGTQPGIPPPKVFTFGMNIGL